MRCKWHAGDYSSSIGVCASCLREKLFVLIAAQTRYHQSHQDRRRTDSDTDSPPPDFLPRSVSSPFASRRKSDFGSGVKLDRRGFLDQRFFSTPQVGPDGRLVLTEGGESAHRKKKNGNRNSFLAKFFRSKCEKHNTAIPGSGQDSNGVDNSNSKRGGSSSWPSPAWFGKLFHSRRRTSSVDVLTLKSDRGSGQIVDKGMSPARYSDEEDERWNNNNHRSSGSSSECSRPWNETPRRTPTWVAPGRRGGNGRSGHCRNISKLGFCLSPLVRASPSWNWKQKDISPVVPGKHPPSNMAALSKNRSRRLTDFGRSRQNR